MGRAICLISAIVGCSISAVSVASAEEWGFSSPAGAVVKILRDPGLNVTGTLALPSDESGQHVSVPVTGRNEPGRLILRFDDPETGADRTITYERGKSKDGEYMLERSEHANPLHQAGGASELASRRLAAMKTAGRGVDTQILRQRSSTERTSTRLERTRST